MTGEEVFVEVECRYPYSDFIFNLHGHFEEFLPSLVHFMSHSIDKFKNKNMYNYIDKNKKKCIMTVKKK